MNEQTPDMTPALPYLTHLGNQIKSADNIWTAIGHLSEALGMHAGNHLETLLCREIGKERDLALAEAK